MIAGRRAKRVDMGGGGALQRRGTVARRGERVELALRVRGPNLRSLVLPGAGKKTQGLPVLSLLGQTAQRLARLGVTFVAAERDRLDLARLDVVRVELARLLNDAQRIARPVKF